MCEKKVNRSSLPSYAWSPWKEGRSEEEQRELQEIQEIRIPDGIRELGNYTFYGCRNLMTLEMTDSVKTIGGGSFTGCGALRKLHMLMEPGGASCIRNVVSETFHEVYVSIRFRNSSKGAELIFPEYYEEGVENTPARILETHYHGCGYKYRQCFLEKKVDYQGYDRLFYLAKVNEKPEILLPMAMGRLLWPWDLGSQAEEEYLEYMKEHVLECGLYYMEQEDWNQAFSYLGQRKLWTEEAMDQVIREASGKGRAEMVGYLMEEKRRLFAKRKKTFDL